MILVMGIDPGVANTGFGVVRVAGGQMTAVDGGVIEAPPDAPLETRLARIHAELDELIAWHEPVAVALEDLYFGKNVRSAIAVGQARGVAMLAAAQRELPCFDYTPQAVKMAVCGSGAGGKARSSRWSARCSACPRRPSRTTPPTRSRSRSATPAHARTRGRCSPAEAPRGGRRVIASVRGEVLVRRPDHVVIDSGGRRLPPDGLGRDAEGGARRAARRRCCTPTSSPATTRSSSTASPPRRSATSSCT